MSVLGTKYHSSVYEAVKAIYPEHEWHAWKFKKAPQRFWDSAANHRLYLDWAKDELQLASLSDWYNVSVKKVRFVARFTSMHAC
jgi:hypothetical protein